ncbi:MAG: AAA family ATPase [Tabrizicola sp.]|uniref:ExeA family protein n=1 Tax=Tabrizicola sp. TaxID=2005166 RepID=UPI002AB7FF5E|nr:AAA family ATPase [Tabrizicola sp.]MDZ4089090.1 AAA family ATPase [Tabrizicola sp.]
MTRQRSRKLFSRILWFDQDAGNDPVAAVPAPVTDPVPEPPPTPEPEVRPPVPVPRRVRSRILSLEPQPAPQGEIYTEHFGLNARPFALTPDPDFLYWPQSHQRAYTMLEYGIRANSPITLITGEVGAGKTTLLLHLIRSLGSEIRVGLISNPHGSRAELLRWVLHALEQPADLNESYVDLFSRFQNFLLSEYAAGRSVVLIFDEAQNLTAEAL